MYAVVLIVSSLARDSTVLPMKDPQAERAQSNIVVNFHDLSFALSSNLLSLV